MLTFGDGNGPGLVAVSGQAWEWLDAHQAGWSGTS